MRIAAAASTAGQKGAVETGEAGWVADIAAPYQGRRITQAGDAQPLRNVSSGIGSLMP
jgi:hypothetical protein